MMANLEKPLLRWAGSKKRIIHKLEEFWQPTFERYLEPFVGSAQLYYAIRPKKAILSDLNQELISTYNTIKIETDLVYSKLIEYPINKDSYYKIRGLDTSKLSNVERAARFIYLNKLCFNGLYRTNSLGKFNVPYSDNSKNKMIGYDDFKASVRALKNAKFMCGDFEKIISKNVRKNDFVYLDPPYAVANRRIFNQYGPQTFGLNDIARLNDLLSHINNQGASFLLSYAYCTEALQIAKNWKSRKIFTQRNISGFAVYRRKAAEILITNINY